MSFLLDTDICSAFFKNHPLVVRRVMLHYGGLHVSAITVGELMTWVKRTSKPPLRLQEVERFLISFDVIDVNREVAETFGQIRAGLLDRGRPVGVLDLFNAAVALVQNLTVVTHNVADYQDVPGLSIVDWMAP
ncbi:MAG: putative nucleic acid-binding protein contains domain [Planctomycetota bacterium]|nr:putative nucleic acid-binding protein contains domain [Planctomycetota bacterium]